MRSITIDEKAILKNLESHASKRNLKVYLRMGAGPDTLGVSMSYLRKITKAILLQDISDDILIGLNKKLWLTGYTEARMLAIMLSRPEHVNAVQLNQYADSIDFYPMADLFIDQMVIGTKWAEKMMQEWRLSGQEYKQRGAYRILRNFAEGETGFSDTSFLEELYLLEKGLQTAPNWAKHSMFEALVAIGKRNRKLNTVALAISRRTGPLSIEFTRDNFKVVSAERILSDRKLQKRLPE